MTEIRRGTAETLPPMLELPETILGRPVPTGLAVVAGKRGLCARLAAALGRKA